MRRNEHRDRCAWTAERLAGALAFAACILASTAPHLHAAEDEKWRLLVEAPYVQVRGYDQLLGDVTLERDMGGTLFRTSESVLATLDGDIPLRFTYERKTGVWGWSAKAWWYGSGDGETILLLTSDAAAGITTTLRTQALVPEIIAPDVTVGRLDFEGSNHIRTWNLEVTGQRDLAVGERSRFFMSAGARFTGLQHKRSEQLAVLNGGTTQVNSHASQSDADVMLGPSIGIHGRARAGKHRFEGSLSLAVVFGTINETADYFEGSSSGNIQSRWENTTDASIPITDVDLRWMYDASPQLSFGLGFFTSIWQEAPVAPIGLTGVGQPRSLETTFTISGPSAILLWHSSPK